MYNTELKERFINSGNVESEAYKQVIRAVFNYTEQAEEESGLDLCAMPLDDVKALYESVGGLRSRTRGRVLNIFKQYCTWCLEQNIPGATDNILFLTRSDGSIQIRKKMVANPRGLQLFLDSVFKPPDVETIDNIYRCCIWICYMGIPFENVSQIKSKDVDLSRMEISFNGRYYPIYRESIEEFRSCKLNNHIYQFNPQMVRYQRDKMESEYLLRSAKSKTISLSTFKTMYSAKLTVLEKEGAISQRITPDSAWSSGLFYRLYSDEVCGLLPDFVEIVKMYYPGISRRLMYEKVSAMRTDYNYWKSAFYNA